jgi:hypothetical protein
MCSETKTEEIELEFHTLAVNIIYLMFTYKVYVAFIDFLEYLKHEIFTDFTSQLRK